MNPVALLESQEWREQALCRTPDAFGLDFVPPFTEHVGSRGPVRSRTLAERENIEECKVLCRRCPVMYDCGLFADRTHAVGVWGGTVRTKIPNIRQPRRPNRPKSTHLPLY